MTRPRIASAVATALMALAMAGITSPAQAANENQTDPAQSEQNCTAAGGTWTNSGSLKTCTVTSGTAVTHERPAGKSGKGWFYEYTPSSTIYTRQGNVSQTQLIPGSTTCINPGGQLITEDFPKHCLPQ